MLALRVARPGVLVDINRLAELSGIRVEREGIFIGALVRHSALERSGEVRERLPLLAMALPHVGHPAIRNRGTFGGSCALADPAAELPACAVALGARFVIRGRSGVREVAAADFFRGLYATALEPGEMLLGARFPLAPEDAFSGFAELAPRHGDYAMVGVAAHGRISDGRYRDPRLVFFGCGDRPVRALAAGACLDGQEAGANSVDAALAALDAELDPRGDLHASAALKKHLAGVLARRVLSAPGLAHGEGVHG